MFYKSAHDMDEMCDYQFMWFIVADYTLHVFIIITGPY